MKSKKLLRNFFRFWLVIALVYLLLLIPDSKKEIDQTRENSPFLWDQDSLWHQLEAKYKEYKSFDTTRLDSLYQATSDSARWYYKFMLDEAANPKSGFLDKLELKMFDLAAITAASGEHQSDYINFIVDLRRRIKKESINWPIDQVATRQRLYRLLYGSRMALEEIELQSEDTTSIVMDYRNTQVKPNRPNLGQLFVRSGDILVSRGGAPTSALIARGNDYPGNFSHVALVYVDSVSGEVFIIESHIEIGVAVATPEMYLKDKKLRILQLRLRDELIAKDPTLPYRAAEYAYHQAISEHIPYDFAMDYNDDQALFCSEVASSAYRSEGLDLWMGISHISSPGLRSWLAAFGVNNFKTQEPSDLEYDPQLVIIEEWLNRATLFQDHIDNAVIDIMLEDAEKGEQLDYNLYQLPIARLMKGYSWVKNLFGGAGPIPEGMSATAALKNDAFSTKHHQIRELLKTKIEMFEKTNGYRPPYWQILPLAREAKDEIDR